MANYFSLIKEHKNVFFSDSFYTQNDKIKLLTDHGIVNKYNGLNLYFTIRFQYAEQLMKDKILHLSSPLAWEDPFEYIFYQEPYRVSGKKYYIACLCMSYEGHENEEIVWKSYDKQIGSTKIEDRMVRLSINVEDLCKSLATDFSYVYVKEVDYTKTKREIANEFKTKKDTELSSIGEIIDMLTMKRRAFAYEKEVRIIVVSEHKMAFSNNYKPVKLDKNIVHNVLLSPLSPKGFKLNETSECKRYHNAQEEMMNKIKLRINEYFKNSVRQSRLYEIM